MTALVSLETVLLVVLLVLVAGLLRSHAELLRRLGPPAADGGGDAGSARGPTIAEPAEGPAERRPAPALHGVTPVGDAVGLDFDQGAGTLTLLAFLTTGCATCAGFWETLAEPRLPAGVETVIVAHGRDRERASRVAGLAPPDVPVVMSSQAWLDYKVPGAPYFVLVERVILGEGVAGTWQALASLVGDAIDEEREASAVLPVLRAGKPSSSTSTGTARGASSRSSAGAGLARARRIDDTLAAAGIGPEHPSLHPGDDSSRGQA